MSIFDEPPNDTSYCSCLIEQNSAHNHFDGSLAKSDRVCALHGAVTKNTSSHIRSTTIAIPKDLRSDGNGNSVKNRLLLGLPRKEWELISHKLTLMNFKLHDLLHKEGKPVAYCYFPNTMMASVLNVMIDGESVEVGLRGWEGFVGLPLVAGFRTDPNRTITQGPGTALRIDADQMLKVLPNCPQLSLRFLRYSQEVAMEVTQIAACNRLHDVGHRLARWLLMSQDRIRSKFLPLTHEFLAQMLGTRRASVTVAACSLQKQGLIEYKRGFITVLSRERLEEASCECYGTIKQQLVDWQKETS